MSLTIIFRTFLPGQDDKAKFIGKGVGGAETPSMMNGVVGMPAEAVLDGTFCSGKTHGVVASSLSISMRLLGW